MPSEWIKSSLYRYVAAVRLVQLFLALAAQHQLTPCPFCCPCGTSLRSLIACWSRVETKLHLVLEGLGCLGIRARPLLSLNWSTAAWSSWPLNGDQSADSPCLDGLQHGLWIAG